MKRGDPDKFFGVQTASSRQTSFRVAALYTLIAGLWILFSDQVLLWLVHEPHMLTRLQTAKGWFFVLCSTGIIYWLFRRNINALRRGDEKLREIAQGVSVASGEAVFTSLTKHLAKALEADYAIICELTGENRAIMRTIAAYADGTFIDNFECPLSGTPCENVVESRRLCSYPSGVRQQFPHQHQLEKFGVESFIGTPLIDTAGAVVGLMAVMNRKPLREPGLAEEILPVFAVRAAVELERGKAEEALRESNALLTVVFDQSFQLMGLMEPDGTLIKINRTAFDFIEGKESEVLGKPFWETPWWTHSPKEQERLRAAIEAAAQGDLVRFDTTHPKPDGTLVYVDFSLKPVKDERGNVVHLVPEGRDITERKRLEETLKTQFDQITTIFDTLHAVVYVADLETNELLYLNRYGTTVFRENWQGNTCCEVLHTGRTGPCESCPSNKLVSEGVPQPPCIWESHNLATGRWHQCIDKAIRWTDGRLVRMEIAVDITELKMLELMKMDTVSVLTHEIRTPLTAMMGYTDLLLRHEVKADQQESFLSTIQNETKRLNELINDFLDIQRLEASLLIHDHLPLSVHRLLQQAASLFSAASDKHRIVVDCPSGLPQIKGDEQQLQRAFKNLLSNAIKYSPKGGTVSLGARRELDNIVIWVKDEGLGIPAEALDKVFDKFYRVNTPEHGMVRGTGLGLALVRETMEAHGGRVWVESQVGAGSTFYVMLPAMVN